jgi:hypothetical protein
MKNPVPLSERRRFAGLVRATRLLLFVAVAGVASAQKPAPAPVPAVTVPPGLPTVPPAPPVPLVIPPPPGIELTAPAETTQPTRVITKEQKIYVPFEKLEQVFKGQEQGVFLPYREFLDMWNKLNLPAALAAKEPPVQGVLASAHYTGKVTGDVATLKGTLAFEALKKGWSKLSLGAAGLALSEAKTTATLSATENGYDILFPDKGAYALDATILGKITREAGRSTLELPLPKTAVSQFELTIPEKGLEFTITPAAAYSATETPEGGTKLLVYFGAADKVSVAWTHRVGETALKPLLFAEAKTTVRIGSGAVRTETVLSYRILRAGVDTLEVLVPADQQVLSVEGENIREWTVDATAKPPALPAGMQRVKVTLHTPAKDNYTLRLKLERALKTLPEAVAFPVINAAQAERQTGTLSLFTEPELTAEVSGLQELTQQAATTAPADKAKEETTAAGEFRYLRLPYAGTVTVTGAKPQVEITSQTLVVVNPDLLELRAHFSGTVKRTGVFGLQIDLPAGLARWEATGKIVESSSVQTVAGKEVLSVKFRARVSEGFEFEVTADAPRAKPDAPLTIPVFSPVAERHEARVGVAIHVSLKTNTTDKGDLREEDVRNLVQIPVPKPELTPLTLGFRYRATAKPAQVQFELRKPRVTALVSTLLEVRESQLRHVWTIDYTVEYAGVDQFLIAVPKEIADDLQIDAPGIKEHVKADPIPDQREGSVVWRVTMQTKVLGGAQVRITHDTTRAETKPGETTPVALREISTVGVFSETGQVAVVKDGNIEIVKNEAKGLELIDPKELGSVLAQQPNIFLAWKYTAHPISLKLDVAKNLYLEVPTALVNYAVLTSVIAEDESETTEAIYWLRNNGQQFFSVQLPATKAGKARLLSDAYVDGEPQQPSRRPDRNELLIRLPARGAVGDAFSVRFVYEVPSPHPGQRLGWRGTLHLQPPIVAGVETLQSRWTLYLPEDHRYVGFEGSMRETVYRRGWDAFRAWLDLFVPQMGPLPTSPASPVQAEPPSLPAPKTAGFNTQLQREGVAVELRRLGEPSAIGVAYRARGYTATVDAIFFLLSLAGGIALLRSSRAAKFLYFMIVGIGALIIAGAVSARSAGFWQAIYLGAFVSVIIWLVCGTGRKIAGWRIWTRRPPQPPPGSIHARPVGPVTPPQPVAHVTPTAPPTPAAPPEATTPPTPPEPPEPPAEPEPPTPPESSAPPPSTPAPRGSRKSPNTPPSDRPGRAGK